MLLVTCLFSGEEQLLALSLQGALGGTILPKIYKNRYSWQYGEMFMSFVISCLWFFLEFATLSRDFNFCYKYQTCGGYALCEFSELN